MWSEFSFLAPRQGHQNAIGAYREFDDGASMTVVVTAPPRTLARIAAWMRRASPASGAVTTHARFGQVERLVWRKDALDGLEGSLAASSSCGDERYGRGVETCVQWERKQPVPFG